MDAFETGCQRLEILRRTDGLNREKPLFNVHQIVPSGREDSVNLIVLEAANFFEVVASPIEQEFLELWIVVQQFGEGQLQLAFDQDFHYSLRGAAQRERIPGAGGN